MVENIKIINKVTLKEIRNIMGKSQKEFAKYVGIPITTYRRYESNTKKMEIGKLCTICDKTGIPIEKIKV